MKIRRFLKKIKLYGCVMSLRNAVEKQLLRLKYIAYKNKARRFRQINIKSASGPKVLIVMNAGGIGNEIEATPLVQAARLLWAKAKITILISPGGLFENWCIPNKTIDSEKYLKGQTFDHTFFAYWEWKNINQWNVECEPGQVHFPRIRLNRFFLKPEREYYIDMLRRLGYNGPVPPLYVSIKQPKIYVPSANSRICLVPGGKKEHRWRHKHWPFYDKLAQLLLQKYHQGHIYIIGTKEDDIPEQLPHNPRVTDLRGLLSLAETGWVLKNANLVIGNDCGPMHISDAVQTPSLVIFGPTCEVKNRPQNNSIPISVSSPR